jgi:hypothetical protein
LRGEGNLKGRKRIGIDIGGPAHILQWRREHAAIAQVSLACGTDRGSLCAAWAAQHSQAASLVFGGAHSSHPLIDLAFGLFLCDAVTLFDEADEFSATTAGAGKIVIGEFTPLALHFALHLFPIAFQLFPIHQIVLRIDAQNRVRRLTSKFGWCSPPNTLIVGFT